MNELKHMAEFHSVLEGYKPSLSAQKSLEGMKLVLLTAPTAGGRNTIIDRLVKTGNYQYIVSDTTREPRVNKGVPEKSGREYWFRSEEAVLDDLKKGLYFEAELIHKQQVSGISIRELERAKSRHKVAISDMDMKGIEHVLPIKPDTIGILILPPSFEEWLRRVNSRGHMDDIERRRRFNSAAEIFAMAKDGKYPVIINDQLDDAVQKVDSLGRLDRLTEDQAYARNVAAQMHAATLQHLKELQ